MKQSRLTVALKSLGADRSGDRRYRLHAPTRREAYQYFGLPLIGLLVLVRPWMRLSEAGEAPAPTATSGPDARIIRL